jgi:hypothetical protein
MNGMLHFIHAYIAGVLLSASLCMSVIPEESIRRYGMVDDSVCNWNF